MDGGATITTDILSIKHVLSIYTHTSHYPNPIIFLVRGKLNIYFLIILQAQRDDFT